MARYPAAVWRPIPENDTAARITPRVAILHSAAVAIDTLYHSFRRTENTLESHFFVKKDGVVEQYMDTTRQADANRFANPFAVAIETEDNGDPDHDEWTHEQLDAIDALLRWLHEVHPAIVLKRCDRWDGAGVGYHTMWGAPSRWTPVVKTCPGRVRREQFDECVLPRLLKPTAPTPPLPPVSTLPPLTLTEDPLMAVFKDDGDREVWFVRNAYLTLLKREPESQSSVLFWIADLRAHGADYVWSRIADSDEGQRVRAAERKLLGI